MQISLSYADLPGLEIPNSNLMACLEPQVLEPSPPVLPLVAAARRIAESGAAGTADK